MAAALFQDLNNFHEAQEMNATQSYCLDARRPYSWVHPLKHPQHMHMMARIVDACAGNSSH